MCEVLIPRLVCFFQQSSVDLLKCAVVQLANQCEFCLCISHVKYARAVLQHLTMFVGFAVGSAPQLWSYHRIIEWLGLRRTSKDHLVSAPTLHAR